MSAKYDASCSSSGSLRRNTPAGIGNAAKSGICHSWTDDGRCISLLKILMTNNCIYDCAYCVNRSANDIPRAILTPEEIADVTLNFYLRNYIEGLFLSSGVFRSADYTMELMLRALTILRNEKKFNGYIHVKAIPGADPRLIEKAGMLADRMSANIELPSGNSLKLLAPRKTKEGILSSMGLIRDKITEYNPSKKRGRGRFVPAGQSTQLIVGASPEPDLKIITLAEALYKKISMKRVYYSAYIPVPGSGSLLPSTSPPLRRENRLYQADWLLRFYGFTAREILDEAHPQLDLDIDPKSAWAVRNFGFFPVEVNRADYETLLRVPGIGVKSALRIIRARKVSKLTFDDLKKTGVVLKRAKYFILCMGRRYGEFGADPVEIKKILTAPAVKGDPAQLSLFPDRLLLPDADAVSAAVTGEL